MSIPFCFVTITVTLLLVSQPPLSGGDGVLDDTREDETAAYRLRLSKWAQGTKNAATSCIFWFLLYCCRTLRSPLRHFMLLVQKETKAGACMFKLVTGKLDELTKEFQTLFARLPEIVNRALHLSGCLHEEKGLNASDINQLRFIALRLLMLHWAAFRRRIIRPLQQYPFKLFWLIKSPPRQACAKRQNIAREVLALRGSQLDSSTLKLRSMCDAELRYIAQHGVFQDVPCVSGSFLFAWLKGLSQMLPADTQAIESINSVIKLVGRRCPNISLELLSSRLTIRRSLTEDGSMRRSKKWSSIKNTAEGLLKAIVGYNTASLAILACPSRWSRPLPIDIVGGNRECTPLLAVTDQEALATVLSGISAKLCIIINISIGLSVVVCVCCGVLRRVC